MRLITGTGVGLVIAAALFPAFNQSVWKKIDRNSALGNLRSMGILVILALILDLIVLTENPFFLYPLALVSAAGVVVLLTIVYTIIFIMALRKECQYSNMKQLVLSFDCRVWDGIVSIGFIGHNSLLAYWYLGWIPSRIKYLMDGLSRIL